MDEKQIKRLRRLTNFEDLIAYLSEELGWPIDLDNIEDAEDFTFEYTPEELGIDPKHAVKVESIKQLRPLTPDQPWGIFFINFESKRLPIVVLRRILRALVPRRRTRRTDQPVWDLGDLLFISAFGEEATGQREIAFAHFHQESEGLPTLRVLGWDGSDTALKLDYVDAVLKERLCWPENPSDAEAWRKQWTPAFRHQVGHVIRTADALAEHLAELACTIRDAAATLMAHETEHGPLRRLHKAFQTALLHDLTEADFADTYAQTITYGLLTAAFSRTEMSEGRYGTALIADNLTDMVPITNPFLREMLETFIRVGGRQGGIDFDELGIQDVVELLRGDETDLPAVLRDFGNRTRGEDPVMHFYEHFLAAYDKRLKVHRGIFYTPQPVVSYMVRSVHELLKSEFGLHDGLASTVTWGEMAVGHPELKIPEGTDPASPFVLILDPATGTATFLVEVIEVIHQTLTAAWRQQGLSQTEQRAAWNAYVPRHLLPRLHGYELMMAPYAIAHMKIGLKLLETGYRFGSEERVRIYLTNTLEPASDADPQLTFAELAPALAHEAQAVNAVKRGQCFTVIVGNPPYAGHSANKGPWIAGLLRGADAQGKPVENYFEVDGHSLNERNPKYLNDDYVKFIRFAQWRINQTGAGILSFITNHGHLDNPTFCGMRQSLLAQFREIYVLDLHGSTKRRETTGDDTADENVFDILPGVSIMLALTRSTSSSVASRVFHADLRGRREHKYKRLIGSTFDTTSWERCNPRSPQYLFVARDASLHGEYLRGWDITAIFPVSSNGFKTHRDHFAIAFSEREMQKRVQVLVAPEMSDAVVAAQYSLVETADWPIGATRRNLRASKNWHHRLVQCLYRPFDTRYCLYGHHLMDRPRESDMSHVLLPNICIATGRQGQAVGGDVWNLVTAGHVVADTNLFYRGGIQYFPLYLYPDRTSSRLFDDVSASPWSPDSAHGNRVPNLSQSFVTQLASKLDLRFTTPSNYGNAIVLNPESIFHYVYALLHSPTYRTRYADFLKIDFPRVPLTSELALFRALIDLGADLVGLHLMEDDYPAASWTKAGSVSPLQHPITVFVQRDTDIRMGKFSKRTCYQDGRVYLDTSDCDHSSYFDGIPQDVWEFQVGGYQVLRKWLYDRRETSKQPGRVLTPEDIAHYQRIVVALKETIRLMGEIDEVIEAHGGWPIK